MFIHDYLLTCEISTVRTKTLNGFKKENMNPNYYVPFASLAVMVIHCCI